jgi:hypothetical protein
VDSCTPVIPAFRRLRQENCEFEVSLGYIVRPYLKQRSKKAKKLNGPEYKC